MHFDLVANTKKYKGDLHEFYLNFKSWGAFKTRFKLNWTRVEFTPGNQSKIPEARGIYVFSVEYSPSKFPPHGYILYVGITGDGDSMGTLYKRYGHYLGHQRDKTGRPAIVYMLDNWKKNLVFYYTALPKPTIDLANLEQKFLNAAIPPINKRDFDAGITGMKAATF
jgi:hypothetical protein